MDIYVSHPDRTMLETFARDFVNASPIGQGEPAVEATESEPAKEAVGDPSLFYVLVRASIDLAPSIVDPFAVVDPAVGAQIVGVFA